MNEECEKHQSPIFTLVARTLIDGEAKETTFELCRYCYGDSKITCPGCKREIPISRLEEQTTIHADLTFQQLKCKCGEVLAGNNIP